MPIRIASILFSLLAHGALLSYFSDFAPSDAPPVATAGQGVSLVVVRKTGTDSPAPAIAAEAAVVADSSLNSPNRPDPKPLPGPPNGEPVREAAKRITPGPPPTVANKPLAATVPPVEIDNPVTPPPRPKDRRRLPKPKQQIPSPEVEVVAKAQPAESVPEPTVAEARPLPPRTPAIVDSAERVAAASRQAEPAAQSQAPAAQRQRIEEAYASALLAAIERHKRYPLRARHRGEQGQAEVRFIIQRDGTLSQVHIGSSSQSRTLDRAALKAVEALGRFEPIPPQLERDQWRFQVAIRFAMH